MRLLTVPPGPALPLLLLLLCSVLLSSRANKPEEDACLSLSGQNLLCSMQLGRTENYTSFSADRLLQLRYATHTDNRPWNNEMPSVFADRVITISQRVGGFFSSKTAESKAVIDYFFCSDATCEVVLDLAFLYNKTSEACDLAVPFARLLNTTAGFSLPHSVDVDLKDEDIIEQPPLQNRPTVTSSNNITKDSIICINPPNGVEMFGTMPDMGINVAPLRFAAEILEPPSSSLLAVLTAEHDGVCTAFVYPSSEWHRSAALLAALPPCKTPYRDNTGEMAVASAPTDAAAAAAAAQQVIFVETLIPEDAVGPGKVAAYAWCSDSMTFKTPTIALPRVCPSMRPSELQQDFSNRSTALCAVLTGLPVMRPSAEQGGELQAAGATNTTATECEAAAAEAIQEAKELETHHADHYWKQGLDQRCRQLFSFSAQASDGSAPAQRVYLIGVNMTEAAGGAAVGEDGVWRAAGGYAYPDCSPYPGRFAPLLGRMIAEATAQQPAGCSPTAGNTRDGFEVDLAEVPDDHEVYRLSADECVYNDGTVAAARNGSLPLIPPVEFLRRYTRTLWATRWQGGIGGIHGYDTIRFAQLSWSLPVIDRSATLILEQQLATQLAQVDTILTIWGAVFMLLIALVTAVGACELGASLNRLLTGTRDNRQRPRWTRRYTLRAVIIALVLVAAMAPVVFLFVNELTTYRNNMITSTSYFQVAASAPGYSFRHPLMGQRIVGLVAVTNKYTTSFHASRVMHAFNITIVAIIVLVFALFMCLPMTWQKLLKKLQRRVGLATGTSNLPAGGVPPADNPAVGTSGSGGVVGAAAPAGPSTATWPPPAGTSTATWPPPATTVATHGGLMHGSGQFITMSVSLRRERDLDRQGPSTQDDGLGTVPSV